MPDAHPQGKAAESGQSLAARLRKDTVTNGLLLEAADEIERLVNERAALVGALDYFVSFGCPVCHGDCASANPPTGWSCPMQRAYAALHSEHRHG